MMHILYSVFRLQNPVAWREMLLPLCQQQQQQPLILPKTFPDRIFPPFLVPKTLIPRCNVRRANSVFVCSSASSDRKTLPQSAIQRIAEKLRSLGFVEEKHDSPSTKFTGEESGKNNSPGEIFVPLPKQLPIHRVGHTIDTSWSTPTYPVPKPGSGTAISRYHELKRVWKKETEIERKKEEKVPSLAELTLPPAELRRLRSAGIRLTKKLKIGKAGITEGIVNGIHERWRTTEVVKIFCEDISRMNMKRTHDVLETKTGGLVIWRSGSKILLYRGVNYQYPYFVSDRDLAHETASGASSMDQGVVDSREKQSIAESSALSITNKMVKPMLMQGVGSPDKVRFQLPGEVQLVEEADRLLEGLGPRFTDWWAYDPLPVDGDLLPAVVPEYKRPFRLLPYGVSPKLTDDEMTTIRRLGRPLPSHFALGRNRNLQGLAVAIVKLWEKCELAKIAVKRGVQNTNSELMAEELKWLTGGTLISRDKDFIVLYRGKDFLPAAVSSAIEERRRQTMIMEKSSVHGNKLTENEEEIKPRAVIEDQKDHIQTHQMKPRQRKSPEAILEKTSMKLSMALEKKANAEKILADLENRESPQLSDIDKEGITNDEKYMLRKIGLKMKPFLLLGRRGVFDGTIENMHLHWKYRELVKIICNEHSIEAAHEVAEILEAESGGILVAVEMVSKGYAIIVYRGKNYERPPCLRPQTLLSKREALKRSVEAQRRKSLKLHVLKLSNNIEELNRQLVEDSATNETWSDGESSNRMAEEETENQHTEPDKSREGIELGYSCDLSVPSSGEENWEDESEGEVDPFTMSSHEYQEDESGFGSSQRHDGNSLDSSANISVLAESSSANASSFHDRSMPRKSFLDAERKLPAGKDLGSSTGSGSGVSALRERKSENDGLVTDLSNRERLILRKQALKMKKRPPFAVGRSNVVTGLARTLKMHFQKNPLAIVNVKGRANGTSVQEVIAKLKEETGALLVSQEPSKVILYRGWGAEEEMKSFYPNNNVKSSINITSTKSFVDDPPHVSPALLEAIRLECGL